MNALAILGCLFSSAIATAFPRDTMCEDRYPNLCRETITYRCSGGRVSGKIVVTPRDRVTSKPGGLGISYRVVSTLVVDGNAYRLRGDGEVKYMRRYLDRWGTWEFDDDVWLYNLAAAQAKFNPRHIPMYLTVRHGGRAGVSGHLMYDDSRVPDDPSFDFECVSSRVAD